MNDRAFLMWLHERLIEVHAERSIFDYMHKLRAIIADMPKEQITPNDGRGCNTLRELRNKLSGREKIDVEDWVAEHVMGFERGRCQGSVGGGNVSLNGTSENWFYCDWCGRVVKPGESGPCPKYPFPKFTLIDLMKKLGENNVPIMVRFDILRDSRRFTIVGPEGRIADTDNPFEALCQWCFDSYGKEPTEVWPDDMGP